MDSSFSSIEIAAEEGVLTITLNRPEAGNALDEQMALELSAALRTARRAAVRCVVLGGAGGVFCSGLPLAQLAGYARQAPERGLAGALRERYHPLIETLRGLEKPVIAAVSGPAVGAGAALALACDLRICAESASFKLHFAEAGLVPPMGLTLLLLQQVGYARAAELCMLPEALSAEEALAWGLANRLVADEHLETTVAAMAARLAALPGAGLGLTKRALSRAWRRRLAEQLEYEAALAQIAAADSAHAEALAALLGGD